MRAVHCDIDHDGGNRASPDPDDIMNMTQAHARCASLPGAAPATEATVPAATSPVAPRERRA